MKCPKCKEDKPQHLVYAVSWQTWRNKRYNNWLNQLKKKPKFDKKTRDYINEYTNTGYSGYICHECNKKMNTAERNCFDIFINTIENKEVKTNDQTQNVLQ